MARDELIELLWGEDDARRGRHSLSQCASLINKMLGSEVIVTAGRDRLLIAEGAIAIDVAEFEKLVADGRHDEALALWRGPLFEGIWVQRAPEFERWLAEERDKAQRLYRRLVHARIDALRNRGDHQQVRDEAERLLKHDPLDETATLAYLESLTLLGDRSLALRCYAEFESRLRKELEAEPGGALKAWVKRQRKGDTPPAKDSGPMPRISEITVLPAAQPFYGRTEEFSMLWKAWEAAGSGRGSFIIIEGEAGIGKTALATKLANQAHVAGGSVCFVKCYRAEKSVPFAPVTSLVRQLSRLPGFVALDPVWIGELSRLVPELRERYASAPQPMAMDDAARHRLSDATVSSALSVADEQSLMIVVDDIQHADEASLALLHYLARQTPTQAVLLVGTMRSDESVTPIERTFLETALHAGFAKALRIQALGSDAIERLIEQVLAHRGLGVSRRMIQRIAEGSRGNPLVAVETTLNADSEAIAKHASSDEALNTSHSESFTSSARARFAELSDVAQDVVRAIAIGGRPLTEYDLSVVTRLGAAELAAAIETLEAARFVRRAGGSVAIVHERYAAVTETHIPNATRKSLHLQFAKLTSNQARANPALRYEVARHALGSGNLQQARNNARLAAQYAGSIGAVRGMTEALELLFGVDGTLTDDERHQLCDCYLHLNDLTALRRLLGTNDGDSSLHASFEFYQIAADHQTGADFESVEGRLTSLLDRLRPSDRVWPDARVLLVRIADKTGAYPTVRRGVKELRRSKAQAHALFATAYLRMKYFWPVRALPCMRRALEMARAQGHIELELLARDGVAILLKQLGMFRESIDQFNVSLALARKAMNPHAEVACLHNRAVSEMSLGDWARVRATHAEAERIGASFSKWAYHLYRRYNNAIVSLFESKLDEALDGFRSAHHDSVMAGYDGLAREAKAGEALVHQRQGNLGDLHDAVLYVRTPKGRSGVALSWIDSAAIAFDDALNSDDSSGAIDRLDRRIRELSRRDLPHYLALAQERITLLEALSGQTAINERERLAGTALQLEAMGIVRWANERLA